MCISQRGSRCASLTLIDMPPRSPVSRSDVQATIRKLLANCQTNDWAGHDPYDALNSPVFKALPLLNHRIPRIVLTQALKRSPIDFRGFLRIPKTRNPKGIALLLLALLNLSRLGEPFQEGLIELMIELLTDLRSPGVPYWCWGYSFPWQTRTIIVPSCSPNLVCTVFVASALLDAYEQRNESRCLNMAVSAAEYLLEELYWTDSSGLAGFSYPLPSSRGQVHNSNFLAAAFLCRVYKCTGEERFRRPALTVATFSVSKQQLDGSWSYGEAPWQRWIDNFHTGYNLCALASISRSMKTVDFQSCIRRGFDFYRNTFFGDDGRVRYFHNRNYPVDIHCIAQSIITLLEFKQLDPGNVRLAQSVLHSALTRMWDDRGFFYYRVLPFCTIRTSYMRWSQAWMLVAISMLLSESSVEIPHVTYSGAPAE